MLVVTEGEKGEVEEAVTVAVWVEQQDHVAMEVTADDKRSMCCGKDDEKLQQGGSGMGGMGVQLRSMAIMAGLSEDGCKILEKLQWRLIVESQQEHQRSSL
ncbi:hypothetical protein B296_00012799 [Ensete ventricosum]|uniref:Uncharacterized protein n=1 Tax=Ensete ventricosum TaxID=4639 RepID=A0A426Z9X9_ENSVE|nr:hypothetical protein B296_00012799 [Ensete ventricosum]